MSWGFQNTLFFSSFFYPSDKWAFSQISLPKCHLAKAKSKNISSVWKQGSMIFPSSLSTLYDFLFTTLHLDVKSSESKRKLILQVEKSFFFFAKKKKKFTFFLPFQCFTIMHLQTPICIVQASIFSLYLCPAIPFKRYLFSWKHCQRNVHLFDK